MRDIEGMTQAERIAFADELEREWHLTPVRGFESREERHLVMVAHTATEVFW